MAVSVTSLAELDTDKVTQTVALISTLLNEEAPELDLKRGVLHDLLLYYSGVLAAVNQENIDRIRRSSSLLAISEDPALADDELVDKVLSNFNVTRKTGNKSTGALTVVVDRLETLTVPAGARFTANGTTFITEAPFSAVTSLANKTTDSDRVLVSRGDGTYFFNIEVSAEVAGVDGLIKKDTLFTPDFSLTNFVKAYATSDFIDGEDAETNSQLLTRLQEGIAAKTLSNRVNISGLIKDTYAGVSDVSIIGYGDAEMLRDQHSIFPVSYGGRADVYVRTQPEPQLLGVTKTATLVEKLEDNTGVWQFSIGRDEAPGFYDVTSIRPLDSDEAFGSFRIMTEIRSNNTANIATELTPDIQTVAEGAYSRYSTSVVRFIDSELDVADLELGSTNDYSVTIRAFKDIAGIQTLLGSRQTRNYGGDVLVKAPVPCFVSLSFVIRGKPGEILPNPYDIKNALVNYVNSLGFCGRLNASALSDIVHNFLSGRVALSAIDIYGQIRRPDGTVKPLRSSELLIIPNEPDRMVTPRTTVFILSSDNISISAETVNIPEV